MKGNGLSKTDHEAYDYRQKLSQMQINLHYLKIYLHNPHVCWIPGNNLSDEIKLEFFKGIAVSILVYGCTTRTWKKCLVEKLDGNN